jgi:hypothetical protein
MPRPLEYNNLIKGGAFEAITRTAGVTEAFLKTAAEDLEVAKSIDIKHPKQRFTLAYEGFYSLVQSVLDFYEVRTKAAGRNLAIQKVAADLKLTPAEFKLASDAHGRRNDTTYRSPFPPISRAEAQAMIDILAKALPLAHALTGVSVPT